MEHTRNDAYIPRDLDYLITETAEAKDVEGLVAIRNSYQVLIDKGIENDISSAIIARVNADVAELNKNQA